MKSGRPSGHAGSISWTDVCALATALPEVQESTYYGYPALKVRGRFIVGTRDGKTLVLSTDFENRYLLIRADPATFFLTDHYRDSPAVLVRLASASSPQLLELIEDAWRAAAPQALVDQFDAGQDSAT